MQAGPAKVPWKDLALETSLFQRASTGPLLQPCLEPGPRGGRPSAYSGWGLNDSYRHPCGSQHPHSHATLTPAECPLRTWYHGSSNSGISTVSKSHPGNNQHCPVGGHTGILFTGWHRCHGASEQAMGISNLHVVAFSVCRQWHCPRPEKDTTS